MTKGILFLLDKSWRKTFFEKHILIVEKQYIIHSFSCYIVYDHSYRSQDNKIIQLLIHYKFLKYGVEGVHLKRNWSFQITNILVKVSIKKDIYIFYFLYFFLISANSFLIKNFWYVTNFRIFWLIYARHEECSFFQFKYGIYEQLLSNNWGQFWF